MEKLPFLSRGRLRSVGLFAGFCFLCSLFSAGLGPDFPLQLFTPRGFWRPFFCEGVPCGEVITPLSFDCQLWAMAFPHGWFSFVKGEWFLDNNPPFLTFIVVFAFPSFFPAPPNCNAFLYFGPAGNFPFFFFLTGGKSPLSDAVQGVCPQTTHDPPSVVQEFWSTTLAPPGVGLFFHL